MASLTLLSSCGARSSADGEMGRTAQASQEYDPRWPPPFLPRCQAQREDSVLREEDQGPSDHCSLAGFWKRKHIQ